MSHTDAVARVVSVLALVIAGGSLIYSARTYRRGGARIAVVAEKKMHHQVMFVVDAIYDDVISVTVRNRGLSATQIVGFAFEEKQRRGPTACDPAGEPLSYILSGNSEQVWDVPITAMLDPAMVDPGMSATIRIHVSLGDGKLVKSNWIEVRDEDFEMTKRR
jgi:hypothetical protein